MTDLTLLLYPWDVQAAGPERIVADAAALGVTRLQIATAYHSAEIIAPRRRTGVSTVAEANTVHLPLPQGTFGDLAIPASRIATTDPDLYPRLRTSADASGITLDGWTVALHNTSLATARPDAAIENCFGDRFVHGLCPASPAARRYAVELVAGAAGTGLFDRVMVESLSYLLVGHGHPHELWGARLDATTRFLLSLCFCGHCRSAAATADIDADEVRAAVCDLLDRLWNAEHPQGRDPDTGNEITSLLLVWPDLAAYTRMRMDVVTRLVVDVAAAARARGARLDLSAAVWGRPAPTNWTEGVDIAQSLRTADGFVLESYFPTAGEVAAEIDHVDTIRRITPGATADLAVAITLWPSLSPTRDSFRAKVDAVRGAGVGTLTLYNYGTAPAPSLDWVRDAAEMMGTLR
ncbi:hypothetical protein [Microbacterium tenebrionis]|uniref:hypothetical protein n=1 Tax=Microbacterium tenebrionis TaxID=2830665 RepID=UPI001588603A|nr:hypothetical protein [Microbacterium ihumii]